MWSFLLFLSGRRVFNSPKEDDLFLAMISTDFIKNLAEVRFEEEMTGVEKSFGQFIGVQKLNKIMACLGCKKQVEFNVDKPFVTCGNCNLSMKSDSCLPFFFRKSCISTSR